MVKQFTAKFGVSEKEIGKFKREFLKKLEKTLSQYKGHKTEICLNIGGFISSSENKMSESINKLVEKNTIDNLAIDITQTYRDISAVLQDPLYMEFKGQLDESGLEEGLAKDIEDMKMVSGLVSKFLYIC